MCCTDRKQGCNTIFKAVAGELQIARIWRTSSGNFSTPLCFFRSLAWCPQQFCFPLQIVQHIGLDCPAAVHFRLAKHRIHLFCCLLLLWASIAAQKNRKPFFPDEKNQKKSLLSFLCDVYTHNGYLSRKGKTFWTKIKDKKIRSRLCNSLCN